MILNTSVRSSDQLKKNVRDPPAEHVGILSEASCQIHRDQGGHKGLRILQSLNGFTDHRSLHGSASDGPGYTPVRIDQHSCPRFSRRGAGLPGDRRKHGVPVPAGRSHTADPLQDLVREMISALLFSFSQIISETADTAISSGVWAPMGSPMGA